MTVFSKWSGTRLFLALILAGTVSALTGCDSGGDGDDSGDQDCGENNKAVVACLGDSITGDVNDGVPPYPSQLAAMRPNMTIINEGSGGETSGGGASRINGVLSRDKPCYINILYGANDVIHGRSVGSVIDNLRYIVQSAKANQTVPILATCLPMAWSHGAFNSGVVNLNNSIRALADEEGVALVDLYGEFSGREAELLLSDGLHPNAAGTVVIAVAFSEKI